MFPPCDCLCVLSSVVFWSERSAPTTDFSLRGKGDKKGIRAPTILPWLKKRESDERRYKASTRFMAAVLFDCVRVQQAEARVRSQE